MTIVIKGSELATIVANYVAEKTMTKDITPEQVFFILDDELGSVFNLKCLRAEVEIEL
jgi:hypothetical protein